MPRSTPVGILARYARQLEDSPALAARFQTRLEVEYGNDPLRILYRGAAATQMVMVTEANGDEKVPDQSQTRADFAAWLVLNKNPCGKDAQADWRLMERATAPQDKMYLLMLMEAGYSVLPPQPGSPSALIRVCENGTTEDVAGMLQRLPQQGRADIINYRAKDGFTAAHACAVNTSVGLVSLLHQVGADLMAVNRGRRPAHSAVLAGNTTAVAELLLAVPESFQLSPACLQTPYEAGLLRVQNNAQDIPKPVEPPKGSAAARQPGLKEEVKEELQARAKKLVGIMECTNLAAAALGVTPPFTEHADVIDKVRRSLGKKADQIFRSSGPN
jgi:hypothetical protein